MKVEMCEQRAKRIALELLQKDDSDWTGDAVDALFELLQELGTTIVVDELQYSWSIYTAEQFAEEYGVDQATLRASCNGDAEAAEEVEEALGGAIYIATEDAILVCQ